MGHAAINVYIYIFKKKDTQPLDTSLQSAIPQQLTHPATEHVPAVCHTTTVDTPSHWTCPCSLPYHNSWHTQPLDMSLHSVFVIGEAFFPVKSKTSCLGSWRYCPCYTCYTVLVIIESFLFVVRNHCTNWMCHISGTLRSIAERPHTHPFPFYTTNFHIPHPLPTFSFNGFGGSFLYQKPVISILICWHEFVAHCRSTALHQNCKVQLTREREIDVQQHEVLRMLWGVGIAWSRQTGAAGWW